MKPFNLEQALAGAKVVTRDGREVKIAGYNKELNSLLGWVEYVPTSWTGDGKANQLENYHDLFMEPAKRTEWVVRMDDNWVAGPYKTHDEALSVKDTKEGATIHEITVIE